MAASGSVVLHAAVVDFLIAVLGFVGDVGDLLESPFELGVAVVQPMLERTGVHQRVHRGVGFDEARVDEDLLAIDQPGLHALPDEADEEALEDLNAPAGSGFGEHAVVGNRGIDVVVQEPEPVQAERKGFQQFAFGANVIEHEEEHQLEDHGRGNGGVAILSVGIFDFVVDELEIHGLFDTAKDMIFRDSLFETEAMIEQLRLPLGCTLHHGTILLHTVAMMIQQISS